MKSLLFVLIIIFAAAGYGQTKYFIYFKDKGLPPGSYLSKSMPEYSSALATLTERAIQRRIKTSGSTNIITYEDIPIKEEYKNAITSAGIKIMRELTWFNSISAYLTPAQYNTATAFPFVEKIEPVKAFNYKGEDVTDMPFFKTMADESNYGNSYTQLQLSDIPVVHDIGITGEGVIVGLLDTGFDWRDHESLINTDVLAEYDFIFDDNKTADEPGDIPGQHSHGTAVLSVVGGYKDSMLIGAAYGSTFLLAKTEDIRSETRVEEDNYAAALIWMENQGVDITSSSLGYNEFDNFTYAYKDMNGNTTIVTKAVNTAFDKGVVTITAAGNEGNSPWKYITAPADAYNIIAVGSVTKENSVAGSSGRGPSYDGRVKPEIVAMGVSVFVASHVTYDNYGFSSGTSLAAPVAAGAVSLLLSAYPHLKNTQVRSIILETAGSSASPDNNRGYGLISAARAISFPNLEQTAAGTILRKRFVGINETNPSSLKLYYAAGNNEFTEADMIIDGAYFRYTMPSFQQGSNVNFYFTYTDAEGVSRRDPAQDAYHYKEGNLLIDLNINIIPSDYVLSQNYPNPFNSSTKIDFVASANETAELVVVDALGQKVKVLFNGVAEGGINTVVWDGSSDNGYICASGVYYYVLKLGGSEYGRKMVLLK